MAESRSIELRLLQVLGVIACVAVVGMLVILPYRLYSRDIRNATEGAHRVGGVVHAALSHALSQGDDVNDLVARLQGVADIEIHLEETKGAGAVGRRGGSERDGTALTYTTAPVVDREGRSWISTMHFDLRPMKRESIRLIIDLVLIVLVGSAAFSAAVYWLVRSHLVQPLRRVTERIEGFESGGDPIRMPHFRTTEMSRLAHAVERACSAHVGTS